MSRSVGLDSDIFRLYNQGMKTQQRGRGRPPKSSADVKSQAILLRLGEAEKDGFRAASDLAGLDLSAWIRERLRAAARKELAGAGRDVPFLFPTKGD